MIKLQLSKKDIDNLDQDNKNMFYTLCETAENLEVSIDKINLELVSHKDLNIFNSTFIKINLLKFP